MPPDAAGAAAPRARRALRRRRDASRRARRAALPETPRRRSPTWSEVRERTLGHLDEVGPFIGEMLLQHEHQHNETMLQTLQLAEPGVYAPERAPAGGPRGDRQRRGRGGARSRSASRARGSPTTTSARATAWSCAPYRIDRAPVTNAQFLAFVEDGGYRRRELWSEQGWAHPRARGLGAAAVLDRRRRGAPLRPPRAAGAQPARDARLGLRGRRLRALARRAAADRGRVGARGLAVRARARGARPARLRPRAGRTLRRRLLGVDRQRVRGLPRLRGLPVPRVLRGLLRRGLPRAARRRLGDPHPGRAAELPQLGPPAAAADLRRFRCAEDVV